MTKLDWSALFNEECPKCGYKLEKVNNDFRTCQNPKCDFAISKWSYKITIENLNREKRNKKLEGYGRE